MNCTGCGKDLPQGAKFCLECGTKVAVKPVCTGCGKELPPEAKFCLECGTKCEAGAAPVAVAAPSAAPKAAVPQNMVLVCGSCGTPAKEGKKFCLKCGANLGESGVMKPAAEAVQAEAAGQAAAVAAAVAATEVGADLPMKDMVSDVNHWSYKIPVFFEDLDMAFQDQDKDEYLVPCMVTKMGDKNSIFYYCVMLNVYGENDFQSVSDLYLPFANEFEYDVCENATVSSKKAIEINGLPAMYFQAYTETKYFHCASILSKNKGDVFELVIGVPIEDKLEYREMMDAFIYSFKLDDEKWNAKIAQWEKEAEERAAEKAAREAEINAMYEEAVKYTDDLLQKIGEQINKDLLDWFPAKKGKEAFIHALNNGKFAVGEYPINDLGYLLTNKTFYFNAFFEKNNFHVPWASITKIEQKKALLGAKTIIEYQEGGTSVTKDLGSVRDDLVKLMTQMWQDFRDPSAQSQAQPASQPAAAQPQARACTSCGKELKPAAKFCPICGASQ